MAAEKGYISKSELAVLKDRILMKTGKPQMYGTKSTHAVSTDNKMIIYLWPVKTPKEFDLLRNSVGLQSINEYIKDLESASDTQVIYDSTLTVGLLKIYRFDIFSDSSRLYANCWFIAHFIIFSFSMVCYICQ